MDKDINNIEFGENQAAELLYTEKEELTLSIVVDALNGNTQLTSETLESILLSKMADSQINIVILLEEGSQELDDLVANFKNESPYAISLEYIDRGMFEKGLKLTDRIIAQCVGDYVLVTQEGSVILPDSLESITHVLSENPVDLLLANWMVVSDFKLDSIATAHKPFSQCLTILSHQIPSFLRLSNPRSFSNYVLHKDFIKNHLSKCVFSRLSQDITYFYLLSTVDSLHIHSTMSFWTRSNVESKNIAVADHQFADQLKKLRSSTPRLKYFINTYLVASVFHRELDALVDVKCVNRPHYYELLKQELSGITKSKVNPANIPIRNIMALDNLITTSSYEEFLLKNKRPNNKRIAVYIRKRISKSQKCFLELKDNILIKLGKARRSRLSKKRLIKKSVSILIKQDLKMYLSKAKKEFKVCLIGERLGEARDSGFAIFKYIRQKHPEFPAYFVTTEDSKDRKQVEELGNFCYYGTPEHMDYFLRAKVIVCTHSRGELSPWGAAAKPFIRHLYPEYNDKKYIMLGHGITVSDVRAHFHVSNKTNASYARFICGAQPEYEFLKRNLDYQNDEIVYTGLARFDLLIKNSKKAGKDERKRILVMPTWRRNICSPSWLEFTKFNEARFIQSEYFQRWSEFLNSPELEALLDNKNAELLFYPHPEVQQYSDYFFSQHDRVEIGTKTSHDLSNLIATYDILITDYSSVFFDFAYQDKPVIYYQFDREKFFSTQYQFGYFRFEKDAFGPICTDSPDLIQNLSQSLDNHINPAYVKRSERFFPLKDSNNRSRIFELIDLEFNS